MGTQVSTMAVTTPSPSPSMSSIYSSIYSSTPSATYSPTHSATYSPTPTPSTHSTLPPATNHEIHFHEHSYGAGTYGLLMMDLILTIFAVVGRIVSRRMMKAPLSTDDALAYIAFCSNFGLLMCGLALTHNGAVSSSIMSILKNKDQSQMLAAYYALAVLYVITITLVKLSILFLYRRVFTLKDTWFRRSWWFVTDLTLLWGVVCIILLAAQSAHNSGSMAFPILGIGITGLVNAISDLLMLSLPVITILKLDIHRKQKVALLSVFAIGAIAFIVSFIRAIIFLENSNHLLAHSYSSYLDIVLTATESSAGLMCACLPLYKPLFKWLHDRSHTLRGRTPARNHGWTTLVDSQNSIRKDKELEAGKLAAFPGTLRTVRAVHFDMHVHTRVVEKPLPVRSAFD